MIFLKIKSEFLVFAYNRCSGYLFILSFLFAYLFIISTTINARKSMMSIACFCWFKDKKHGLPCVDFKDNRDNRDNSLNLAFANRHKPEVRAMALILYIELSQMHNKHIFNRLSSQASVAEGGEYP